MEEQKQNTKAPSEEELFSQAGHTPLGRAMGGIVIIATGAVLLARQLGVAFPDWLFTWPMIPIVIGLYVGAKHRFQNFGFLVPIFIGLGFLAGGWIPGLNLKPYIVPVLLIVIGVSVMFKRDRKWKRHHLMKHKMAALKAEELSKWQDESGNWITRKDDFLELTAVFGGIKKQFISKDFKGGIITCIFGGAEIDLSHADINGVVEIELTHICGGSTLTVPSSWHVRSDITAVLGGVEDNRVLQHANVDPAKTLILKGTCIMGGITIQSY